MTQRPGGPGAPASSIPDSEAPSRKPPRMAQIKPLGEDPRTEVMKRFFLMHNYELLGEIGRGGMGVVYLGQDTKLGRRVAIKTLSPERARKANSLQRFEREARTFAAIRHPHICNLYEYSDDGDYQFLAMEYIEGTDLESERRSGKRWSALEMAKIVRDVADALDHTHSKGILHRDIKPGNILIEYNTGRTVLTDFGLAKGQNDITLTASGYAVGTPAYMAPEQISDQFGRKPDGRSDLFSLGTVAFEMLTGKHPFLGPDDMATMRAIVQKTHPRLRDLDAAIPEPLENIVNLLLEKSPEKRPANGRMLAELLQDFMEDNDATPRRRSNRTPAPGSPDPSTGPKPAPQPRAAAPDPPSANIHTDATLLDARPQQPRVQATPAPQPAPVAAPAPPTPASAPATPPGQVSFTKTQFVILLGVAVLVGVLLMTIILLLVKK